MLTKYHTLFPEIREWHDNVIAQVRKTSVLKNLFGHPRIFTGHQDESAYKEWFAFVPQSTVGQITNYAFTELQEGILAGEYTLDFDVLENNHDSILWQSLPENRDKYAKVVNDKLCRRLVSPRGEEFFMKSEAQWSSESWGSMLEIKL
jgi:DNA polymerase I-like protein with 3'-5' exonuclease and polymerase domains